MSQIQLYMQYFASFGWSSPGGRTNGKENWRQHQEVFSEP